MAPDIVVDSPVGDTPGDDNGACSRWGDYADIELDPDDATFWVTGMYMKTGGDSETEEEWGSYIANRAIGN